MKWSIIIVNLSLRKTHTIDEERFIIERLGEGSSFVVICSYCDRVRLFPTDDELRVFFSLFSATYVIEENSNNVNLKMVTIIIKRIHTLGEEVKEDRLG